MLRATFDEELDVFLTFARENGLGEFQPTQCELTYINHLLADRGWASPTELSNVLAPWSGRNSEPYLPAVEDIRFAWQYRFEERGSPLGRLYVQLQSGIRSTDRAPVLAVTLTARGAPSETAVGGVLSSLDRMHEWIVRGFTAITTDQMHEIWERQK